MASTITAPSAPVGPVTAPPTSAPAPAPWSLPPLAPDAVPVIAIDAWTAAENHLWCSALLPVGTGPGTEGAVARQAEFAGGWAVAWDLPGGPGTFADGSPCEDCGRSAFGVAGVGLTWEPTTGYRWPDVVEWTDGSVLGFGGEGFDPMSPKTLGEIHVAGQGCMYQVWTHLGPEHLRSLVEDLRFVEGLQAATVELRLYPTIIDGGPSPWSADPIPAAAAPELLVADHAASGVEAPLLAFESPGLGVSSVRRASLGAWGVAWDRPDGPGHDRLNTPCADCGRGVVGLGARPAAGTPPTGAGTVIEWEDGSFAEYGLRLGIRSLPPELVVYRDAMTGELVPDGWEARVVIPGVVVEYVVWSHLGEDHLLFLLANLRFVEG